ncbi:MAG: SGNH/GDSL hydrolase family protein [Limnochordia bacterium]|jgi:acyl-CoA thioesterase-1
MEDARYRQLSRLVQFWHPEKMLSRLHPQLPRGVAAQIFGIDEELYGRILNEYRDQARQAAEELLADGEFAEQVARLPLGEEENVVGLGDSITDDLQSWFAIFSHVLELTRPGHKIKLINAGISGETTSQIISRFWSVVVERPTWIICLAGTNDARRHGKQPTKTLVSIEETALNFQMLRNFARAQTSAQWLWMTPASVLEDQIRENPDFAYRQVSWVDEDLEKVAQVIRDFGEPFVDLRKTFGVPPHPHWLLDDGLHPSLMGQKAILRALVARWAALGSP